MKYRVWYKVSFFYAFLLCTVFCSLFSFETKIILPNISAVTYELNGGRLGDNLLSYCKAKWLSYTHGIPLINIPFPYSKQLNIHAYGMMRTNDIGEKFDHVVRLSAHKKWHINKYSGTLYIKQWKTPVAIDWYDRKFVNELKKLIAPCGSVTCVTIPSGCISVAIHVRRGGGYVIDKKMMKHMPNKFAPEHFYVDQIKRILSMYSDKQLYVHIFTDDPKPKKIVSQFKAVITNERITWGYRKKKNRFFANVLEDFFSMMQFDCLIRPGSNFSRFVERLGDHQVVIYPCHAKYSSKKRWIIDKVAIKQKCDSGWVTKKEKC